MSIHSDAKFAETITSPGYRGVLNSTWESEQSNIDEYNRKKDEVENILQKAIEGKIEPTEADWEARRLAALARMSGPGIGQFEDYIHSRGGTNKPGEQTKEDLGLGEAGPVQTNSIVRGIKEMYADPIDFLDNVLDRIDDRKKAGPNTVGPENFATSLKYFADKYRDFPSQNLDRNAVKSVVARCVDGFTLIANKEKPNFIEMTNIYHAIRVLPLGSFPPEFTRVVVGHSLEILPSYSRDIFPVLFGALSKLQNEEVGNEMATLVDLSMRQYGNFETTTAMRLALRAINNLKESSESNRAFATFLELRNNLEEPMDLDGLDETNGLLLSVANNVIDDPGLTLQTQDMAKSCAGKAVALYKKAEKDDDLSEAQLAHLHSVVDRIVSNWTQI